MRLATQPPPRPIEDLVNRRRLGALVAPGRGRLGIGAWLRLLAGLFALLAWSPLNLANNLAEYRVKAGFLYNFAKYVEWPAGAFTTPDAPLLICVAGGNPFGDALASLAGKSVGSHAVEVRHMPTATGLEGCHVVFISGTEQGRIRSLLVILGRLPILTVGDSADFAQTGGIIGLTEADQRIAFTINLTAARQAGLKLSSQLLKLATILGEAGGGT